MKIVHRVATTLDAGKRTELSRLGIEASNVPGAGNFASFDIEESHASWPAVNDLIARWGTSSFPRSEFTEAELAAAGHVQLWAWNHGYPQPERAFGYLDATYAPGSYCEKCRVGMRQHAPFRMKNEPKWGRNHILQMNWVTDEFFVLPEIWEGVFKSFGIGCQPVLHYKDEKQLETVVQLDIAQVAKASLSMEGEDVEVVAKRLGRYPPGSPLSISGKYLFEKCTTCGRIKYDWIRRGYFPALKGRSSGHLFRTQEWFGSGGEAGKAIIVSAELYKAMKENKLRGATFIPLAS